MCAHLSPSASKPTRNSFQFSGTECWQKDSKEGLRSGNRGGHTHNALKQPDAFCVSKQTRADGRDSSPRTELLMRFPHCLWQSKGGGWILVLARLCQEWKRGLKLFCLLFQIENPRYLREKPIPLSPVSFQGVRRGLFIITSKKLQSLNSSATKSNPTHLYLGRFSSQALGGTAPWLTIRAHSLFIAKRYAPQ